VQRLSANRTANGTLAESFKGVASLATSVSKIGAVSESFERVATAATSADRPCDFNDIARAQ
jgi:hypothetical protein